MFIWSQFKSAKNVVSLYKKANTNMKIIVCVMSTTSVTIDALIVEAYVKCHLITKANMILFIVIKNNLYMLVRVIIIMPLLFRLDKIQTLFLTPAIFLYLSNAIKVAKEKVEAIIILYNVQEAKTVIKSNSQNKLNIPKKSINRIWLKNTICYFATNIGKFTILKCPMKINHSCYAILLAQWAKITKIKISYIVSMKHGIQCRLTGDNINFHVTDRIEN